MDDALTPGLLLQAYGAGIFPMAESRDSDELHWIDPKMRGVFPLENFHISKSLRKSLARDDYRARFNSDFAGVVQACADRPETWINATIQGLYQDLHEMGRAHCQEIWDETGLVGGVYGVVLGGAFFGESMFSKRKDASKMALAWLIDRLRICGFVLFDTQFVTPHLLSLGAQEISRKDYRRQLETALDIRADIRLTGGLQTPQGVIQRNTQTSYRG